VELKMAALIKEIEILIGQETCGFVAPHRTLITFLLSKYSVPRKSSLMQF
jgi:hypothetical protein